MIDSENKRRNVESIIGGLALMIGLVPSGSIDSEDRRNVEGAYIGIKTFAAGTARPFYVGKMPMFPGGGMDNTGAYVAPIKALNGSLTAAAATQDQPLTAAAGAGKYAYLLNVQVVCVAAGGACAIEITDDAGGDAVWRLNLLAAPTVGQVYSGTFQMPPRTDQANGQFYVTTVGATSRWDVTCNGYIDSILDRSAPT